MISALSLLASCAASAPPLPADTTASNKQHSLSASDFSAADMALDCNAIQTEQLANASKIDTDNEAIKSNRRQNEVAGYLGGILIVPLVATESNSAEKDEIASLQHRQDILRSLATLKECRS